MKRFCACLLNISEGRDINIIGKIAEATTRGKLQKLTAQSTVLNIFSDYDYNRSVLTIASSSEHIGDAVIRACKEAYRLIDLSTHTGGHPRLGAVDLIPIHPLSDDVSLHECGIIASGADIAHTLSQDVPGTSFFLFGATDVPQNRGLVQRRKEVSWFSSKPNEICVDVGSSPPSEKYGLTGIGAIPYVMNCNVTINTSDIALGKSIASSVRAASQNGFPGVQSMAFNHHGKIEIACNVEAVYIPNNDAENDDFSKECLVHIFGDYYHTSAAMIEGRVREMASKNNVSVEENMIVGFAPGDAYKLALEAITSGQSDFWRTRSHKDMM